MLIQQGDVLIKSISVLPQEATKKSNNHLAEGEVTGHFHEAQGNVAVLENKGKLYLSAPPKVV